jgi:hypothetical protein
MQAHYGVKRMDFIPTPPLPPPPLASYFSAVYIFLRVARHASTKVPASFIQAK